MRVEYVMVFVLTLGSLLSIVGVPPGRARIAVAVVVVPVVLCLVLLTTPSIGAVGVGASTGFGYLVAAYVAPLVALVLTLVGIASGISRLLDSPTGAALRPWLIAAALLGVAIFFLLELVTWLREGQAAGDFLLPAAIALAALLPALTLDSRVARISFGMFGLLVGYAMLTLWLTSRTVSHYEFGGLAQGLMSLLFAAVAGCLFLVGAVSGIARLVRAGSRHLGAAVAARREV